MVALVQTRTIRIAIAALLAASCACSAALAADPKRVMVLHSFGREFKPWSEHAKAIRTELDRQSPWPLEIIEKEFVTARSGDENPEVPFVEYLRALFAKRPLDLIVSIGGPAADFVQRRRQQLFATTPMVFTAVEQRLIQRPSLTENDTVVAISQNFPAVIENILRVLPDTKTVAVVIGNSTLERLWLEVLRKELAPFAERVSFIWYDDRSFADILKRAAALPPHSAIYWHQMNVDAAGVVHHSGRALPALYAVANAPIFAFNDAFFGGEVVGGPMNSVAEGSRQAAAVAVRILGGEKAGDIKIPPVGFATAKYDWRQMQRWGISEKNLPQGSEIYFREPTIWQQYFWWLVLTIAVLVLQTALIVALVYEVRRRRKAEVQAHQRMSELAHMNRHATMGELSTSLTHELGQPLGAILANAETAEMMVNAPSPDMNGIKEILADIRRDDQRAADIIRHVRSIVKKAPGEVMSLDLNDVVRETFEFLSAQASVRNVTLNNLPPSQPLSIKGDRIQLQQVIINLIMNGMDAMAGAPDGQRRIIGRTTLRPGGFAEISISDFGPGISQDNLKKVFDPFFTTKADGMGMGLSIARTIVEAHHGRIWAENHASGGAVFRLVLPLAKSVHEAA
jgi:signal transduction histidine kinase/ABC-type uncharacterized transport system substrate-binding protein